MILMLKTCLDVVANHYSSKLFTHLYEFFGTLLGCSQQGQPGFPAYDGQPSMFQVHKYVSTHLHLTSTNH
jgi:hypothetical protein